MGIGDEGHGGNRADGCRTMTATLFLFPLSLAEHVSASDSRVVVTLLVQERARSNNDNFCQLPQGWATRIVIQMIAELCSPFSEAPTLMNLWISLYS
jgi:hypothetical protein